MDFLDSRDNSVHRIWINDTITLKFADGSTAEFKLIGPGAPSGLFFQLRSGSERGADGKPLAASPPPTAAPGPTVDYHLTPVFAGPDYLEAQLYLDLFDFVRRCAALVSYTDPDGTVSYVRHYYLCQP